MRRRWLIRDVCTRRRGAGHPPAVVLDAEGRNGTGMHGIACACPLAETGGVLSLQEASDRARRRLCGQDVSSACHAAPPPPRPRAMAWVEATPSTMAWRARAGGIGGESAASCRGRSILRITSTW